jgi:ATP-dependent Clp protease ATP-binding subunit ClpA
LPLFSKFSPAAWRVVRVAEQESRNHNDYFLGAEHLLVALLEERGPSVTAALREDGIDVHELYAEARRSLGRHGGDRLWDGIILTPRLRKIVQIAEQAAAGRQVEPLDLLRAIRAEGASLAAAMMRKQPSRDTAATSRSSP